MLNRRSFCLRSAASVAAVVSFAGTAEAKQVASSIGGNSSHGETQRKIPMDDAQARSLILEAYRKHVAERAAQDLPPLPLNPTQTTAITFLLRNPPKGE